MATLFDTLTLRGLTLRNRIGVSPMCMYSTPDGRANDWHLVHLGSRASGGAGLIITEATAVEARGRISPNDLGLWNDDQAQSLAPVARFVHGQGAALAVQLAHAGRKAGTARPWEGGQPLPAGQAWPAVGPSAIPFDTGFAMPAAMSVDDLREVQAAFVAAARRAAEIGVDMVELHAAHGYLLHSFLSPLNNQRADAYGGGFDNRVRFLRETAQAVRQVWPDNAPLAVRLSCTDWAPGGWTLEESVALAGLLKQDGVDLIDCSSGGAAPRIAIPAAPGYQVPFATAIGQGAGIPTAAVGMITEAEQANAIVTSGSADLVLLGRVSLRDPYWPIHAGRTLGVAASTPLQYLRAW